jgi:uncharacterized protein YyaL (SSP411 family)
MSRLNRLTGSRSGFLKFHAGQQINWYPWGPEAFRIATEMRKPIYLNIGYYGCERSRDFADESFENEDVANLLNTDFVPILVDADEFPEVSLVFREYALRVFGIQSWPLSIFMTPGMVPFIGGAYFPPERQGDIPSFKEIIELAARLFQNNQGAIEAEWNKRKDVIMAGLDIPGKLVAMNVDADATFEIVSEFLDYEDGGLLFLPKYIHTPVLEYLMDEVETGNEKARRFVSRTLSRIAFCGLRDPITGGFFHHSKDKYWMEPSFEVRLSDNLLLAQIFLRASRIFPTEGFERIALQAVDFVIEQMTEDAGLATYIDAENGLNYYMWSEPELEALADSALNEEERDLVFKYYQVRISKRMATGKIVWAACQSPESFARGNGLENTAFQNMLSRFHHRLLQDRIQRPPMDRENKSIAALNGIGLSAMTRAWNRTGNRKYLTAAESLGEKTVGHYISGKRLCRFSNDNREAYLDDYVYVIQGLLDLYDVTKTEKWMDTVQYLTDRLIKGFRDSGGGPFYMISQSTESVIMRPYTFTDGHVPNANAVSGFLMAKLYERTQKQIYLEIAEDQLDLGQRLLQKNILTHLTYLRLVNAENRTRLNGLKT